MAWLSFITKNIYPRNLPDNIKMQQALNWLRENPIKKPTTTARLYYITNKQSVQQT